MESVHLLSSYSNNKNWKAINISNKNIKFEDNLSKVKVNSVLKELEEKFGMKIDIRSVKKGNKNVSKYATSAVASPIAIAPNILEKMSTDLELKQKITSCVQKHIDSIPSGRKFLAAHGRQLVATGTIVHEDGTVTHWTMSNQTPEEKEKIRKQIEAETKEKLERKEVFLKPSKEVTNQFHNLNFLTSSSVLQNINGYNVEKLKLHDIAIEEVNKKM